MQIQLKGFYLKEEADSKNGQRSYTVMDRKGIVKALVFPETNKEGKLCNYLIINISSVPKGYEGTKVGIINSLRLSQEERNSFELWWTHGIINQLSKPDQEITFNVGESGPTVILDGFKYTFGTDFVLMSNVHSNDSNELIEIYAHIFDMSPSVVKGIFKRVQTYLREYAVTPSIDPSYGVFEIPEPQTEMIPEPPEVTITKFRCTITNLNARKIPNLAGLIYSHVPLKESAKYIEIDPHTFKIIFGELKEQYAVLSSHQPYEPENSIEETYGFGGGIATFKPQTFTFATDPEIKTYTLDFYFYITHDDVGIKEFYNKVKEMKQNPDVNTSIHHIIL